MEMTPVVPDPDRPDTWIVTFREPEVPMPDDCAFQLAPYGHMILRVYDSGEVELGEGVSLSEASESFWLFLQDFASQA